MVEVLMLSTFMFPTNSRQQSYSGFEFFDLHVKATNSGPGIVQMGDYSTVFIIVKPSALYKNVPIPVKNNFHHWKNRYSIRNKTTTDRIGIPNIWSEFKLNSLKGSFWKQVSSTIWKPV